MNRNPRWLGLAATAAAILLLGGGAWFYAAQERAVKSAAEDTLYAVSQLKIGQIAEWRSERLSDAAVLARSPYLASAPGRPCSDQPAEVASLHAAQTSAGYRNALVVDASGRAICADSSAGPLEPAAVETLSHVLAAREPQLTPLYLNRAGQPEMAALAPILRPDGVPSAAVALLIDPEAFLYPLIRSWPMPSRTAESLLARRDGDSILFLNELRHQPGAALKMRIPMSSGSVAAVRAALGERGVISATDYRSAPVLAAIGVVPGSDWLLVAKVDAAEAFEAWHFRSRLIIAFLITLLAVLALAARAIRLVGERKYLEALLNAEAARVQSEERYRTTLLSVGDGVIATDANGLVTLLNPASEALTGWTQDLSAGRPVEEVFQIVNEQTGETVENPVRRVLREGLVVGLANHTALVSKDGKRRSIADSGAPIRGADGSVAGVILVFRDVSETSRYEREREATLEMLSLFNREGDAHELVRTATAMLHRWTGCEAIGIRMREGMDFPYFETRGFEDEFVRLESHLCATGPDGQALLDNSGHPVLECMCGNVLSGRFNPEKPFFTERGSFWTNSTSELLASTTDADRQARTRNRCHGEGYESVALIRLQTGPTTVGLLQLNDKRKGRFTPELMRFLESMADQLAVALSQRQAQQELRRSETVLRENNGVLNAMLEHTDTGVACLDQQFRFIWVNRAYANNANELPASFTGKRIFDVFPDERTEAIFRGVLQTGEPHFESDDPFRFGNQPDRGTTYWDWSLVPVKDDEGAVHTLVLTLRETTQHIRAAEERERLQAQFLQAQKMESVGRLAGGVAHDFNNLLTVICGYGGMALNQLNAIDPLREPLEEVVKAADRAAELVRQLLAFSRKQPLRPEVIDLNETVKGMVSMLVRLVGEDIRLVTRLKVPLSRVLADRRHIGQVIVNLAVNARDAIVSGGEIAITTGVATMDGRCPRCGAETLAGHYVELVFSDTGCGMDKRTMERLFEPFFTTKEVGKGTGLGLATVHGIVAQSGGHIDVESELGQGSSFRILLPAVEAPAGAEPSASAEPAGRGSETVLLVEDQAEVRNFTAAALRSYGYKVVVAPDAVTALRAIAQQPVDVLVTDVVMPGTDGPHLAAIVRERFPKVRALFMSGYSDDRLPLDPEAMERRWFIQKPFSPDELAALVRQALDEQEALWRKRIARGKIAALNRIYLDYHATTPVDPRVLEAMLPYFGPKFGNAASRAHSFGWEAEEGVEMARRKIAALAGCAAREIVFTSGATESDNLALKGAMARRPGGHVITVATEHKAVLDTVQTLERAGYPVTVLPPEPDGLLSLERLRDAFRPETALVSVMLANNEIGVIQPVREIGALCRERGAWFHCDAAQGFGKVPLNVEADHIDLMSLSAHKMYGPKGVGALFVRRSNPRVEVAAQMDGGGHEFGMRSGTLNVPAIVGFGEACALVAVEIDSEAKRLSDLRNRLRAALENGIPGATVNGSMEHRLAGNLNMRFPGLNAEALLLSVPDIALSTGSACSSATAAPSHVLRAIGLAADARSSVRIGLGRFTTMEEVDAAATRIVDAARRQRELTTGMLG